jgi:hypothetical protein
MELSPSSDPSFTELFEKQSDVLLPVVLTQYAERYKAGTLQQISFADWQKGVEASKSALAIARRAARNKPAEKTL